MALISYIIVSLFISSISTEVVFSPSTLPLYFRIPSLAVINTTATLTNANLDPFLWEVVQKIGECESITVSPQIGSGYKETELQIYLNLALMKASVHTCTVSVLCSTNSQNIQQQNIADLTITLEVMTNYCYDQSFDYCTEFHSHFSHCNKTTGLCECNNGYYGVGCQRECREGPFEFRQCGDHGHCNTAPDFSHQECICDTGCSIFCDPALNCTGNAHCSDQGRCECDEGYHGLNCSTYCTEEFCSFAGKCSVDGTCQCNTGRYGDQCQFITCPYCVHGTCNNSTGTCECPEGYSGAHCDKHCNSTTCGEHGHCGGLNGCECDADWYGPYCENYCNSTMCNHGTCSSDGKSCDCDEDWYGPKCDNDCTCNNHGKCNLNAKCECNEDYYGPNCAALCIDGVSCGLNGQCDHVTGECVCLHGYYGTLCTDYCTRSYSCNGNGNCNSLGQCDCDEGYSGLTCYSHLPSSSPDSSTSTSPSSRTPAGSVTWIIVTLVCVTTLVVVIAVVVRCTLKKKEQPYEVIVN